MSSDIAQFLLRAHVLKPQPKVWSHTHAANMVFIFCFVLFVRVLIIYKCKESCMLLIHLLNTYYGLHYIFHIGKQTLNTQYWYANKYNIKKHFPVLNFQSFHKICFDLSFVRIFFLYIFSSGDSMIIHFNKIDISASDVYTHLLLLHKWRDSKYTCLCLLLHLFW